MPPRRYAASRQKACRHCSTAKSKCDRKARSCTRCAERGLSCDYPGTLPSRGSAAGGSSNTGAAVQSPRLTSSILSTPKTLGLGPELEQPARTIIWDVDIPSPQPCIDSIVALTAPTTSTSGQAESDPRPNLTRSVFEAPEMLDFSGLELLCPINTDDIANRWLNPYIPIPDQRVKKYPPAITTLIYKILKSYTTATVRGRGYPPFIHPLQVTATSAKPPLATCLSLVRICEKLLPGSEKVAADVLQKEMTSLYQEHGTYDDVTLLAAFQSYLIYSMVIFFTLRQDSNSPLRQALMSLQDLASSSSRRGLICTAEQQRARPRWEAWIITEAKRRALFTMYLFDSLLSAQDNLPAFLGTELQGLPAPMNKFLWRVQTRGEWEDAYNIHLVDWPEGGLCIDELWPIPAHLDELGLIERRNRVEHWLENVDEFGTMLYAVTSCTHNG